MNGVVKTLLAALAALTFTSAYAEDGAPVVELATGMAVRPTEPVAPKIYNSDFEVVNLANKVASKYGVPYNKAVHYAQLAKQNEGEAFPKAKDILAVIGVESGFRERAASSSSLGLMQINYRDNKRDIPRRSFLFSPEFNIKFGSKILKSYYAMLGNRKGTIIAYNVGIGNYLAGRYKYNYLQKYLVELHNYQFE